MGIRAWRGLHLPESSTHRQMPELHSSGHTGSVLQNCERHATCILVQDLALVFPQARPQHDCLQFVSDGNQIAPKTPNDCAFPGAIDRGIRLQPGGEYAKPDSDTW